MLCLPRNLHFQCAKCRSCQEICYWRCSKCCACHEICSSSAQSAAPATKSGSGGAQGAAPATKSAVPVHKVLLLPRNLLLEMLKVLRPPRNLHIQIHIAQRCQGGLQWQAQLFVRNVLFLMQINFLFDILMFFLIARPLQTHQVRMIAGWWKHGTIPWSMPSTGFWSVPSSSRLPSELGHSVAAAVQKLKKQLSMANC